MLTSDVGACAAQKLTNRFLLFLGEWFLNTGIGLPFFQVIAIKNPDLKVLQNLFTKVVRSIPTIASIDYLTVTLNSARQCLLGLSAKTSSGQTIVGGEGSNFVVS